MGLENLSPYGNFTGIYVSRPICKLTFGNGFGLYILTAFKIHLIPRFYFMYRKDNFLEAGFYFCGLTFEIMWNKAFKR